MKGSPIQITELTAWRGVFILMIFFHHVDLFPAGGTTGVAFFFLLSGFAMTLGYSEKVLDSDFKYGIFLWKRAVKFYPIHWLMLFAFLVLNYLCSVPVGIKTFVPNFLLLQSFIPDRSFFYAYNSPSWYLCNTLFFVALFPFIIRGIKKLKDSFWLKFLIIVLVFAYIFVELIVPEEQKLAIIYINPFMRLFDYVVGVLAGLCFLSYLKKKKIVTKKPLLYFGLALSVILLIGVVLLPPGITVYSAVYWIPLVGLLLFTSLISITGSGAKFLRNKYLVSFGGVSFAFYMVHSLCIDVVKVAFSKLSIVNQPAWVCLSFIFTVICSYIATYYFINPVSNRLNNRK